MAKAGTLGRSAILEYRTVERIDPDGTVYLDGSYGRKNHVPLQYTGRVVILSEAS